MEENRLVRLAREEQARIVREEQARREQRDLEMQVLSVIKKVRIRIPIYYYLISIKVLSITAYSFCIHYQLSDISLCCSLWKIWS